jgi:nicotinamide riboside kinase
MYVMKVWCEVVFGKVHPWILEQIPKRKYDLYLLCDVDLPWTQDGLREYPDLETRTKLFQKYKVIMESQSTPWILINGNTEERLLKATTAVDELLKNES